METKTNDPFLLYGIFTSLAMIIVGVLLQMAHLSYRTGMANLVFLPFIAGIVMNAIAFSKANGANITYGQAFLSCFKATIIIGIIGAVWAFVSPMIFPGMIDQAMEASRAQMEKMGNLSEEQVDKAMSISRSMMKLLPLWALIGDLIAGAVFSAVAAAIAKKNPAPRPVA